MPTPAPAPLCTGEHMCGFSACTLSQAVIGICSAISDETECNDHSRCRFHQAACEPVSTVDTCLDHTTAGVDACTTAGTTPATCAAQGAADQVEIDACLAAATRGEDACNAAGDCIYTVGDCSFDDGATCTVNGAAQVCTCDEGLWGTGENRCIGTHDGTTPGECTGADDGTGAGPECIGWKMDGRRCQLNAQADACEVDSGDCTEGELGCCIFVPEVPVTACQLNSDSSACAIEGGDCAYVPSTGAPCALDVARTACEVDGGDCAFSPACAAWSVCELGVSFEVAAPTPSSDRVCQNVTVSSAGQYVVSSPTLLRDTVVANCYSGTYQSATQQPDCPPCPVGSIDHDHDPSTDCTVCPVGKFQLAEGEVECILCAWGTYDHDYDPTTPCIACDVGFNSTNDRSGCRPNRCDLGRDILHSDTDCIGMATDECDFECDQGYTAVGDHVCGTGGWFAGGWCAGDVCTEGSYLDRSPTTCTDQTSVQCSFRCDPGYSAQGSHICEPDGRFIGGFCSPNRCTEGLTIEYSNTTCNGTTGDECDFECWPGYTETATHVCDTDGAFKGGSCTENPPERTFCVRCREGYYGKHGLCFGCADGWQDVEPDQTECEPCPDGYAGTAGFCYQCDSRWSPDENSTACEECPRNFATGPKGMCWECGSGYMPNMTETDSVGCVECPEGKAGVDGFCFDCVNGSQPNALRSACEDCPEGRYSPDGSTCLTCGPGLRPAQSGLTCEYCPPGYAGHLGICSVCLSGQQPHGNRSTCETCPLGFAGKNGLCTSCEPGAEPAPSRTDCVPCGFGQYKKTSYRDVSSAAAGASVLSSATQPSFYGLYVADKLIDGIDDISGWAFSGLASRSEPRTAIFTLVEPAGVHTLRLSSGNLMPTFHVTGMALYYTEDAAPSLDGEWRPVEQIIFDEPVYHGSIEGNRVYDNCYRTFEITVVIRTRSYGSDIAWSIDDGPRFGNGEYPDNAVVVTKIDISKYSPVESTHVFRYYDIAAPLGGWNGGYFELYAHDGTFLGGGADEVRLGILQPGTNPVTSGFSLFTIDEDKFYHSNCTGQLSVSFHAVTATGFRVDVIDTDTSDKNALVNEVTILANTDCFTCADGFRPDASRTNCEQCGANAAGVHGSCTMCPDGTQPNSVFTECVDCPTGQAGLDGFCYPCVPGKQPNGEQTECVLCTPGTYSYAGTECVVCPTGTEAHARPTCGPLQGRGEPEEMMCPPDGRAMTAFKFSYNMNAFQVRCDLDAATDGTSSCPSGCIFKDDEFFPATCTGGTGTAGRCDVDASTDDTSDCLDGCTFNPAVILRNASCIGDDDGAATPCTLNDGGSACAVEGGDCVYEAAIVERAAACAGDDDGTGNACALNDDSTGCSVEGGDCVYEAAVVASDASCVGSLPAPVCDLVDATPAGWNLPAAECPDGCNFAAEFTIPASCTVAAIDAVCIGADDGSGTRTACALNSDRTACAVQGGDCVYTAASGQDGWNFLALSQDDGAMQRTDMSTNGTTASTATTCSLSHSTVSVKMDVMAQRRANSSRLTVSVDGVDYAILELTGLSTTFTNEDGDVVPVTRSSIITLNGATVDTPMLVLETEENLRYWNRDITLTIGGLVEGTTVQLVFTHAGVGWPSSSIALDNVVVVGGLCGNDDAWANVGRCLCEPGDTAAAMGKHSVATAVGHLHVGCEACPAGSIGVAGVCFECDSGSRDNAARGECEYCPPARAGLEGICGECALGFQASANRTECVACESGWYRDSTSPVCLVCQNGTTANTVVGFSAVSAARAQHVEMLSTFTTVFGADHDETRVAQANLQRFQVAEARESLAVADVTECIPCPAGFAGAAGQCRQCASGWHPNKAALIPLLLTEDLNAVFQSWWSDACRVCWLFTDPETGDVVLTGPWPWDSVVSQEVLKSSVWRSWCILRKHSESSADMLGLSNGTNDSSSTSGSWAPFQPLVPTPFVRPPLPWWSQLADATICVPCPPGSAGVAGRCHQCAPGSEPNAIRSECVDCAAGKFSVAGEQCLTCPTGMGADYLKAGCLSCPSGSVGLAGVCSECDSGSQPNATRGACEECPVGRAGIEGECSECPPGTEVDMHRTACLDCTAGKFKMSNRNLTTDLPSAGRLIATAWVLIRATKWDAADRVRVWVEDADSDTLLDATPCEGSAATCTLGCQACCGTCCDTPPPVEERILLDISLTKNRTWGNTLVEDQWKKVQADVTGFRKATFKFSTTMVSGTYDDDHAAKLVLFDSFSVANELSGGVYAYTSFEEPPTAGAGPYKDEFCEFGGADYNLAHRLKTREKRNPVSYATERVLHDHSRIVWGGAGAVTGGVEQHWIGEERGFDTYCKQCTLVTSGNAGVVHAPIPNGTGNYSDITGSAGRVRMLRYPELLDYLNQLGIEIDEQDLLSLLERLDMDVLSISLSAFMGSVADEVTRVLAAQESGESDSGSGSWSDDWASAIEATVSAIAAQTPYAAVHGSQYFAVENVGGTVEVHLHPMQLKEQDPINHLRCKRCSDGYSPGEDHASCEPCPANAVSTVGQCERCPSGFESNYDHSQCIACSHGRAGVDGYCVECPPGTAPNYLRTECETCMQGKHSRHGEACSYCPDGYSADPSGVSCNRCLPGSYGIGGTCTVCPSGKTPNLGWVANASVGWVNLDAGFCAATGNRYELIKTSDVLSWDDALARAASYGGYLATILSEAEQDCVAEIVRRDAAWIGANSRAGWAWQTGEPFCQGCGFADYTNWAEAPPQPSATSWAAGPAFLMMNWAGHDEPLGLADVRRDLEGRPRYPGRWYACGGGCPRPKNLVVEYEALNSYTCVGCPWGHQGTDGICIECPAGTEVHPDGTRCKACDAGKYKLANYDNVAAHRLGGKAAVSHESVLQLINATVVIDEFDGLGQKSAGWSMSDATPGDPRSVMVSFRSNFTVYEATVYTRYAVTACAMYWTDDNTPTLQGGNWYPLPELAFRNRTHGNVDGHRLTTTGVDVLDITFAPRLATGLRIDVTGTKGLFGVINEIIVHANLKCELCRDGFRVIPDRTDCERCPSNYAGVGGVCAPCLSGQEPNPDRTECLPCSPGFAGTDGYCSQCDPGSQPNEDLTECVLCTTGSYSYSGTVCAQCATGREATARPPCEAADPCPVDGQPMTVFRFDHDVSSFQQHVDGTIGWSHAGGAMQRTDDLTSGAAIASCVFRKSTITITLDIMSRRQTKTSSFQIAINGVTYILAELPGLDTVNPMTGMMVNRGNVFQLNGASSNKNELVLGIDTYTRTWNRNWVISISGLSVGIPLDLAFAHSRSSEGNDPSSDVAVDNVYVTGGVCGSDDTWANLGRCVCDPRSPTALAAMGRVTDKLLAMGGDLRIGCQDCPLGYIGVRGQCKQCESGKMPNHLLSSCIDCMPGFAGIDGFCHDCGPGEEPIEGPDGVPGAMTQCKRCAAGKYKVSGFTECYACWKGSVALENRQWCQCPAGFTTIEEVPVGCSARGIDRHPIDPEREGFLMSLEYDFPVLIRCDLGCRLQPYVIRGSGPYTQDSSICAAATHATGENGGYFEYRNVAPRTGWDSATSSYITSLAVPNSEPAQRGFSVRIPPRIEQACVDLDECEVDNGGCDVLTQCTNMAPGRSCGECPNGYAGPLPRAGWAMSGNTTCIPIPKEGDQEMLLPELSLDIQASGAVLFPESKERARFEKQLVVDVSTALGVKRSDVIFTAVFPAVRRLSSLRQLQTGFPTVLLTVSFTVKSEEPTVIFRAMNEQLALPNSVLRTSNVTGGIVPGQTISASSLRMVCPPKFVETEPNRGACMACPAGTEYSDAKPEVMESCTGTAEQVAATCTGTADEVPVTCSGFAEVVPESCTGISAEVILSCSGAAADGESTCDLDAETDDTAICPDGCTTTGTCSGTATAVGSACTGIANEVPRTCTGTAFPDTELTCDLDSSTDFTDACPPGCTDTAAYTPTCDLDSATDGTDACPSGCTDTPGFTATCDLDPSTDGTAECPAGCDDTTPYNPACDLDASTDGTEFGRPGLYTSETCPAGCTYRAAYVPQCDLDPDTDETAECPVGCTERIDFPTCDFDPATDSYLTNAGDCPAGCTETAAFTPICDLEEATISSTIDDPAGCSIGCTEVSLDPNALPQIDQCIPCPHGKYSKEGQPCIFCGPGSQANNYSQGATGCQNCLELGPKWKSHNGTFCSECIATQIQSTDATECMCEAGRYNTTAAAQYSNGAFKCVDLHGQTTALSSELGLVCESCPRDAGGMMVPCIDCSGANASGVPMPGYWRTSAVSTEIMRCPFGERACVGGVDTQCHKPFGGIACASCTAEHFRTLSGCEPCPTSVLPHSLPSILAAMAMCVLIGFTWRASAACGAAPELDQALDSSPPKMETKAVVLRMFISFLQSQAILSRLQAEFPPVTSGILAAQTALVDIGSIASWASCWVKPAGMAPSFLPPVASAHAAYLSIAVPGLVYGVAVFVRRVLRIFKGNPSKQKGAAVFKKFQTGGFMARKDFSKLASKTGTGTYDDEAWTDWCTMVSANPAKGMDLKSFEMLYMMKGPDGEKELEFMFSRLFPSGAAFDQAIVDAARNNLLWDQCVSFAVVALYVIHPLCTASLLSFFSCEKLLDSLTVLRSDRGTQCYTPSWLNTAFTVVVPSMYLFCHLVPASCVLLMRGHTQEGTLQTNNRRARFGFVFRGYRPAKALWELVVTGRKLALAWVVIFLEDYGVAFQSIVSAAILQGSLLVHAYHHPHTTELAHRLEMASLCVTAATTLAAALHVHLKDIEALIDCSTSPIEQPFCGEASTGRADAAFASTTVVLLDLAMCAVMSALIWYESFAWLQAYLKRSQQSTHKNVVGKVRDARLEEQRKQGADLAEKLRRKALAVDAASKTCNQFTVRVKDMSVEVPELRPEIEAIGDAVDRLGVLIAASKDRTKEAQANFTRGELKQKLRSLAVEAGVVRDSHWTALFARYDKDNSGELDVDEFRRAIRLDAKVSRAAMSDEEINQVFDWVDIDKGGSISAAEFEAFLAEDGDDENGGDGDIDADIQGAIEQGQSPKKSPIKVKKGAAGLAAAKYMVASGGMTSKLSNKFGAGIAREKIGAKTVTEELSITDTVSRKAKQINLVTSFSTSAWGEEQTSTSTRGGQAGGAFGFKRNSTSSPVKPGKLGKTPMFLNRAQSKVVLPVGLAHLAAQSEIVSGSNDGVGDSTDDGGGNITSSQGSKPATLNLKRPGRAGVGQPSPPTVGDPGRRAGVGV